jgi:gamma-glutamylcyclotransferase (GGCT)/AIG2-like uncharacterized protein YtfP
MTLYFAYGANMDRAGMAARCRQARAQGPAVLERHHFVISGDGYASVVPARGESVHGVLWRLSPRDLAALNIFESLDSGLYRRASLPVRIGGRRVRALLYVARKGAAGKPRPGYLGQVIAAARDWGLPQDYVRRLERRAPSSWRGKHPAETGAIA